MNEYELSGYKTHKCTHTSGRCEIEWRNGEKINCLLELPMSGREEGDQRKGERLQRLQKKEQNKAHVGLSALVALWLLLLRLSLCVSISFGCRVRAAVGFCLLPLSGYYVEHRRR